jgi:hypothetical protein
MSGVPVRNRYAVPTLKARALIGTVAATAVLGAVAPAAAQEAAPRVLLRWNAPEECPDDAELLRTVEQFLGEPLAAARQQQLSVSLNVTAVATGFSANMRFGSASGVEERSLEHPECVKLMEACALLTALAIDPERVRARQDQERVAMLPPRVDPAPASLQPVETSAVALVMKNEPEPQRDQASVAASPLRSRARATLRPWLEVVGFTSGGVLPKVGPGLGAEVALEREHFKLGLVGRYWIQRTTPVPQSQNGEIEIGLWTLGLRACALSWLGQWSLRGCVGADMGDMVGTGQGLAGGHDSHAVFSALTAGLGLRYGSHRLAPVVGVEGAWGASRPRFGVIVNSQKTEVFQPHTWSVSGSLGLAYEL